jgi:hypothetical protein
MAGSTARGRIVVAAALGAAMTAGLATPGRAEPEPVASRLTWTDPNGRTGELSFQGGVEGERLDGIVRVTGVEIPVHGTVSEDGQVTGAIYYRDGTTAGTFTGQVDAALQLNGTFDLDGAVGSWTTPAAALPLPEDGAP